MNTTDRSCDALAAVLLFACALAVSPLAAQDPCTLTPYDGTNENGLGVQPGFVIEYCSEIFVPAVCLDGSAYFVNAVQVEATETTGGSTMPFSAQVRVAELGPLAVAPGRIIAGPTFDEVQNVPNFPASQTWVTPVYNSQGRFSVGFDAIQLTSACAVLDGDLTGGQFLGTDESPATPLTICWKGEPPAPPAEDCRDGAPGLRALRVGMKVSPYGGVATGDQEVPPVNTSARGIVRLGPNVPGGDSFWLEVRHDVLNPVGAHIHQARTGSNGPIVVNLGDPTSPIFVPDIDMMDLIDELFAGELYVNVHSAAFPSGEIRSQLDLASVPIFEDGFESGDTSSWSTTVP